MPLKVTSGTNRAQDTVQTAQWDTLLPTLPASYLSLSASSCPNLMLGNPSFFFVFEGAIPSDKSTTDLFPACRTPIHPSRSGSALPSQAEWSLSLPGSWSSIITLPRTCGCTSLLPWTVRSLRTGSASHSSHDPLHPALSLVHSIKFSLNIRKPDLLLPQWKVITLFSALPAHSCHIIQ